MGDEKGHEEPLGEEPISPERRADNFLNGWSARIADKVMGIIAVIGAIPWVVATGGLAGEVMKYAGRGDVYNAILAGLAAAGTTYLTLAFGGTGVRAWKEGIENP